ncbi:MAG: helix-turn-helix transcriptional regulator [Lachnospiraceae bacterium]|nr:helix-turn-helix transcriptional regulator [Lachnospiraceae bacterium]
MENFNFQVTEICRIIKRPTTADWHTDGMYYPNEFVMVLVLDGETEYIVNHRKYIARKDDLVIFPPQIMRSGRTNPKNPWSFISIIFRMELDEDARAFFNKSILIWNDMKDSAGKLFQDASKAWTGKNPLYRIKCNLLVTEILYKIILSEMPYHNVPHIKKLEKTRNFIQENFRNELSIEELANSIDMSVSYFRRLFHEAYGYSPMQYIMDLRIENARDLLLSGEVNVTEAARLSGFEDIYYFSALFKRKTGFTPTALLKKG